MNTLKLDILKDMNLNRYEAVIIASQHARRLNLKRIIALEKMEEDPTIEIEPRKITMVALKDLLDGNVKYERKKTI